MKEFTALIKPFGKAVNFSGNPLLIDLIYDAGYSVKSPCGGKGICGKCSVKVSGKLSDKTEKEISFLPDENMRLACISKAQGDIEIIINEEAGLEDKFSSHADVSSIYGAAVDIGTTSVKISLVDLNSGKTFPFEPFLNPQRRFGHDVVSRISSSGDIKNLDAMSSLIHSAVENRIFSGFKDLNIAPENLKKIVISANTVMSYIFHRMEISGLGIYPYMTPVKEFDVKKSGLLGMKLFPEADVYTMPAVSAYIGGDLVSGAAFAEKSGIKGNIFFADLGTNGEIFLKIKNRIFAASCAMGPALEGMNLSCGMTAGEGALTHAEINGDKFESRAFGKEEPVGISGTGLIDAISLLIEKSVISRNGAFNKKSDGMEGINFIKDDLKIFLTDRVYISQKDIRNFQLAKGAVFAAAKILMETAGAGPEEIDKTIIAGSFGSHLDLNNFRNLKFLPDFANSQYIFIGNSSLESAQAACLDMEYYKRAIDISREIEFIELSNHKNFNDIFMESLDF